MHREVGHHRIRTAFHHYTLQRKVEMSIAEMTRTHFSAPDGTHHSVVAWVEEIATLTQPDAIVWCTGSADEADGLADQMVETGTLTRLNDEYRPHSFLARSDPSDVARVESRTFICSAKKEDAGPSNN